MPVRAGLVESDPLRAIGYMSVFADHESIGVFATTVGGLLDDRSFSIGILGQHWKHGLRDVVSLIHQMRPGLRLLVIGIGSEDESIPAVLNWGASGYLSEHCSLREFRNAIEALSANSLWVPHRFRTGIEDASSSNHEFGSFNQDGFHITRREQQVLDRLVEAGSNREIAEMLGIEERTVKGHVARLMRKTGVGNRTALSLYALKQSRIR